MDFTLKIISIFTSILAVSAIIIKGIELMRTSKVERLLLSDNKRIITAIIETLFISFSAGFLSALLMIAFEPEKRLEIFTAIFFAFFVFALMFQPTLYFLVTLFSKKKTIFYFEPKEYGKLYIHKINSEGEVLTSKVALHKHNSSNIYVFRRDFLHGKELKSEVIYKKDLH